MSEIVERTFAAFPRFLSSSLLGGGKGGPAKQTTPPRGLQALLQAVDNAQSRSEEEAVVHKELTIIKQRLNQPGASVGQLRELLPRIIFCSVIGYDVSFCQIHAIKLAQAGTGMEKRAGYLASTLMLHPGKEVTILMMGTLHRDLHSSNMLDVCLALSAAAHLVATEHVPHMLPAVLKCLDHRRELVREKAVHCLHAFFLRAHSLMSHTLPQLNSLLKDKDPGVLSALVSIFVSLAAKDPDPFLPLGMPLLNVLQQVRARRFPTTHDYHGIPLPWLQISLLKVLGTLGARDHSLASAMLPTLTDILREVNPREFISLAAVYQCVLTVARLGHSCHQKVDKNSSQDVSEQRSMVITSDTGRNPSMKNDSETYLAQSADKPIQHDGSPGDAASVGGSQDKRMFLLAQLQPVLLQASQCVASFLRSGVHNLRYLGVKSLAQLVVVSADLAVDHQMVVVKCLDDPDPAVQHQTLTLLHHMANPANVKVICAKLLEHVHQKNVDSNISTDVAQMVCDIAGRLAPDPKWYLDTLLPVLSLSIDIKVVTSTAENMLKYLMTASKQQSWPQFSKQLFVLMIDKIQRVDISTQALVLQFAVLVLRFVPLEVQEIDQTEFLSACQRVLQAECASLELKESVVLCVQHLMMKGLLDSTQVVQWLDTTSSLHCSQQRRFKQIVAELRAVASLQLSEQKLLATQLFTTSSQMMDFTLSFADAYVSEVLEKGQPLLKRQTAYAGPLVVAGTDFTPDADISSHSPSSQPSMSTSSPPEAFRQGGASVVTDRSTAGDSQGYQSVASSLRNVPGVKPVWSKQGVAVREGSQTLSAPVIKDAQAQSGPTDPKEQEEKLQREELARALFQGVSASVLQAKSEPASTAGLPERFDEACAVNTNQNDTWDTLSSLLPTADTGGWRALHQGHSNSQIANPSATSGLVVSGSNVAPVPETQGESGTIDEQLARQGEGQDVTPADRVIPTHAGHPDNMFAMDTAEMTADAGTLQDSTAHSLTGSLPTAADRLQTHSTSHAEQTNLYSEFLQSELLDLSDAEDEEPWADVGGNLSRGGRSQDAMADTKEMEEMGVLVPRDERAKESDFLSEYMLSASPAGSST